MTVAPRPQPTYRRSGNYAMRRIAGETIIVPIRSRAADLDSIYVLNEVGAAIWGLLETDRSAADIARAMAAEFDVTGTAVAADVEFFLGLLSGAALVESRAGA